MTRQDRPADTTSPRVVIRLLGPVLVTVDGEPLAVDTRKAVALLAWLAVARRPASREALAALLWPDSDGPDSKGALRRTLSVLRAGLHDAGLAVDRSSVALRVHEVDVDVWRFRTELGTARSHDHPSTATCADCLRALTNAAQLARGDFMEGFALRDSEPFDEWQLAETESHRRDLASVLERLARGHASQRSWEPAASAARRWLGLDALHEPAHRLLMQILARSGEHAAAIAQYRECVRVLDRELGVAPLASTTELADAIRAGDLGGMVEAPAAGSVSLLAQRLIVPLVGRDQELHALTGPLDGKDLGGRLMVIEGEPGIGKTRLAAAAAAVIRERGGSVLEARAYPGESAIPFSVVVELLRAALTRSDATTLLAAIDPEQLHEVARLVPIPGIGPRPPDRTSSEDPFGRVRLFQALTAILGASVAGPSQGLIVIDDLHLADASSLECIAYMARRLPDVPVGILVAWRPEELPDGLRDRLLGASPLDRPTTVIELTRLGHGDIARLAATLLSEAPSAAVIDALFVESEGLPLYVVEALAGSPGTRGVIPGGFGGLLRSRVAAAGDVARQLLGAAAVIGRSFEPALVRAASGRSEDETIAGLEELARRGLVREVGLADDGDLRHDFTHGRLRDVVYEGLSLSRRRVLHGRVADALRADPRGLRDGRLRWSLIAHHETLAGRTEAAADAHRRAGDDARAVFANDEARVHLETALALGHPDELPLRAALGDVLTLLGDYVGSLFHLEAAAATAGPDDLAGLEYRIGLVHARRGEWARADSHLVAASAAMVDRALLSRVLADRSAVAERAGHPAEAQSLAREALALAEAAGDAIGVARGHDLLGILARRRDDLTVAHVELEQALATLDEAERADSGDVGADPGVRIAALNSLALVVAQMGDPVRAMELTELALRLCERQGDRHRQAALENNLADLLHTAGREAEAMTHLTRAVALFADIGGRPGEFEPEIWKLVEW